MIINRKMVRDKVACEEGLWWWDDNIGDAEINIWDVIKKLEEQKHSVDFIRWAFKEFKLTGICHCWYDNGQSKYDLRFEEGVLKTIIKAWDKEGNVTVEMRGICEDEFNSSSTDNN